MVEGARVCDWLIGADRAVHAWNHVRHVQQTRGLTRQTVRCVTMENRKQREQELETVGAILRATLRAWRSRCS